LHVEVACSIPLLPHDTAMLARSWESQFCPSVRLSVRPSDTGVLCD